MSMDRTGGYRISGVAMDLTGIGLGWFSPKTIKKLPAFVYFMYLRRSLWLFRNPP